MSSLRSLAVGALLASVSLSASSVARARSTGRDMFMTRIRNVHVDGLLREWSGASFSDCSVRLRGRPSARLSVALGSDGRFLYLAGRVRDPSPYRTERATPKEDHAELTLVFPSGRGGFSRKYRVQLYPGIPGKVGGTVKMGRKAVAGAELIEAPSRGGVTFEAKIPWSVFPPAARNRIGLRAVVRYVDGSSRGVQGVVANSRASSPRDMPTVLTPAEWSVRDTFFSEKGISGPPDFDRIVDLTGDRMRERILRYGRFVIVVGPHFQKGESYYWLDLGVDPSRGQLPMFRVQDLTGDGKAEVIVRKRIARGSGWRELFQVLSFGRGSVLQPIFEHETGLGSAQGTIENRVRIVGRGKGVRIVISVGKARGFSPDDYHEPTESEILPMLLPWGEVKSETFAWKGGRFVRVGTRRQKGGKPVRAQAAQVRRPPAPRAPTSDELLDKVLALYRHDHGVSASTRPSFDFVTDVAGDDRVERILVYGTDLVVIGKGYREGRGYVSLSMAQFSSAEDIVDVTARDLTGDGHAELIVRGVQRTEAPEEIGKGSFAREVLYVYRVKSDAIERIFGAELAVENEGRRIHGLVAFVAGERGLDIELRPGRARGWTHQTWPYRQDDQEVSGVQPLVLPWTDETRRFSFDGQRYVRR